jgi:predicted dienelactone hydrolase
MAIASIGVLLSSAVAFAQYTAEAGKLPVATVETLTVPDARRSTDVVAKIYYPDASGVFPVIVFSHGLGGNKNAFEVVARHWASRGYISIHPTHDDRGIGLTDGRMILPPDRVAARVRDIVAMLDALDHIEKVVPALSGRIDRGRLAVAGHSYGAFVAMLAGGVTVEAGDGTNRGFGDPRVRCVLPVSPAGRGDYGFNDRSWANLDVPALFITGTRDVRGGRASDWRMEPYRFSPAGGKYLVVIEDAAHASFGRVEAGNDAPAYVQAASTAFWDGCLREDAAARTYLTAEGGGFRRFAGTRATLSSK